MLVEKVTLFKFEAVGKCDGALTLLADDGRELETTLVNFDGNSHANLGYAVKTLIQRSEYLK